jgi:tetratricopeptide (TPR) repeat protein
MSIDNSSNIRKNKVILLLMVKNESSIIERCLKNAIPHVDAVFILDTGSTDNTIEVANEVLKSSNIVFKILTEQWINFGYNRTLSFLRCRDFCKELEWDMNNTYAFAIDADMIIMPCRMFSEYELTLGGYSIIQKAGTLEYYNIRLMKINDDWKCIGATHEYWSKWSSGSDIGKISKDVIYINDVNDGGCKSDKFERDIALLIGELKENPVNPRTNFYLGQSYKDTKKYKEAIHFYKKRIEIGGWTEEVWYSYYMIAKCYRNLEEWGEMESWAMKGYTFYPRRAENIYLLVEHFRNKGEYYKAYHYLQIGKQIAFPVDDILFIEYSVYNGLFDYEETIIYNYIGLITKMDGSFKLIQYINNKTPYNINNVWNNLHYYTDTLISDNYEGEYSKYLFPNINEFSASSPSIVFSSKLKKWVMNIRYVNYNITPTGEYIIKSSNNNVMTTNASIYLNRNLQPTTDISLITENLTKKYPTDIKGLEDVRLFEHDGKIMFSCATKELVKDGMIRIAIGQYDVKNSMIHDVHVIESPTNSECEKNWIHVPFASNELRFIYSWYPFTIGYVDESWKLNLNIKHDTPAFFSRIRGSSNVCEYDGKLWCVVHYVRYSVPRVYYHCIVKMNRESFKPEFISAPFCFRQKRIEYCLGFNVMNNTCYFVFSENDSNPGLITAAVDRFKFCEVPY